LQRKKDKKNKKKMTISVDGHNMLKGEIKTKKTTYEICKYKFT